MKKSSLPVFGVGPIYVITCSLITVLAFHLKRQGFFQAGEIASFDLVFQIFGIILIFAGVFFWIYAVLIQNIAHEIQSGKLVTTGIYSVTRHPIYTAFFFIFSGILITAHNIFMLGFILFFYLYLVVFMQNTEEKWLTKKFGQEYLEYAKRTPRILPKIKFK